jgi:hypothetical protein
MKTRSSLLKIGLSLTTGLLSLVLLMAILATGGSAEAQGKEEQIRPMRPAAYAVPSANRQPASPNAPLAVCRRESAFPGGPNGDKMACIPAPGSF